MCVKPLYIKIPETNLDIFDENQRFLSIPCGKCDECRVSNSKEWGVRCMLELDSLDDDAYKNSWFITLTYDNEHCPQLLRERDMQLFIKRLRKHFKTKMKYFYCGEYGSRTFRPHYHMILFNCPLTKLKFNTKNFNGDIIWHSDELTKIWGNGNVVVGGVSAKSAAYTARYCLKKNETDCYMRCSKGFGKKFFFDHMDDIIANGYVSVPGDGYIFKAPIPKYFLKLYRQYLNDDEQYSDFIKARKVAYEKFKNMLLKKIPIVFEYDLKKWKEIGNKHPALLLNDKNKRITKQALMDLYQFRDNF